MTRKPLRSKPSFAQGPWPVDPAAKRDDAPGSRPAKVSPEPVPPLDEMEVAPLTDAGETKGG